MAAAPASSLDVLHNAIEFVTPHFDASMPLADRLRNLWAAVAAVAAARDLGAADVVEAEFHRLARDTGLAADLGRHAEEDLCHVIQWAMLNRNPFSPT
jgi:hypothetical protein